ncbi:alpha/beta fold hydrolase [Nonomuraea rosea]|uniref:Alpha/beta fold hydrolase n=1 Tax=Nonomuraea rosea TaxID=638574 RepID=A0ABP6XHF6_9ACTN
MTFGDVHELIDEIAGVPALARFQDSPERAAERGTVLFYHGFSGYKERMAPYLTGIAEGGFLAIGLDAVGHGARRRPDFAEVFSDERWETDFEATESDFIRVIQDTAAEVPALIDALCDRGWAHPDRVGIAGRSLGAEVSYLAVLIDSRLRAAAPIVGSPEWTLPRPDSPHRHPESFFPVAILSQTAENDEYVPTAGIRAFHDLLAPHYAGDPARLEYVEYPGVGHFLAPELNEQTIHRVVAWFGRWLSSPGPGTQQGPER